MVTKIKAIKHITAEGERWDTLAWRYYGNPFAYGGIIEANPALNIQSYLPSGRVVLIPLITVAEQRQARANNLPSWMR